MLADFLQRDAKEPELLGTGGCSVFPLCASRQRRFPDLEERGTVILIEASLQELGSEVLS